MSNAILALNAGSSSFKFGVFVSEANADIAPAVRGAVDAIGAAPHFVAHDPDGAVLVDRTWPAGHSYDAVLDDLLTWVDAHLGSRTLVGVGHRIVHGGRDFIAPVRLDETVLVALDALTPLAPLHQPHSLAPVAVIAKLRPGLPQFGCFDTAFHRTMPAVATRYALPRRFADEGVQRYGFHGLSYEFIARRLREIDPVLAAGRVIVAHLGNGASLCAMRAGRSIDTTMGFTALDGLVMGTRCGAIDPGVLLYLLQQKGLSPHELEHMLYSESGLLGVSGLSSDMRTLLASDDPAARAAVDLFVYRIARETAALAGSLGGLDGFVFTGGIGEHAAEIHAAVRARLHWLGVRPDHEISADRRVAVHVIPTDEEMTIARHTSDLLFGKSAL
jgi:acetate kinase